MDKKSENLLKTLKTFGTAEVDASGNVLQVTQALKETGGKVQFMLFGELKESNIKAINDVCNKCSFWKKRFTGILECQSFQKKEAEIRGFKNVICSEQLD
jgi:hypothetical protein